MNAAEVSPCFFYTRCGNRAELSKQGKAVCKKCALSLTGEERVLYDPADRTIGRVYPNFWNIQFSLRGRTLG